MSDAAAALRQRAEECERKASLTTDQTQRGIFLELARQWREMAGDYETLQGKERERRSNAQATAPTPQNVPPNAGDNPVDPQS